MDGVSCTLGVGLKTLLPMCFDRTSKTADQMECETDNYQTLIDINKQGGCIRWEVWRLVSRYSDVVEAI